MVGVFGYTLFGLSLRYIDVSIAAVLYETWIIWMIVLTQGIFRNENRYENIKIFEWLCILVGFFSLAFVIMSHIGGASVDDNGSFVDLFYGVTLVLISAVMAGVTGSCTIKWGAVVSRRLMINNENEERHLSFFFILTAVVVASIPNIIIGFLWIGWHGGETIELNNYAAPVIHGFFVLTASRILFRKANLFTTKLKINSMTYASPALALLWLFAFGYVDAVNVNWLVIGSVGIVIVNFLLNCRNKLPISLKCLLLLLWGILAGGLMFFIEWKYEI